MTTLETIQGQILAKLEAGEDVSELTRRLAEERAKILAEAEVAKLQAIADERHHLRNKATEIQGKVKLQNEGIDRFLKLRDTLLSQLQPLIAPMKELAAIQAVKEDGPSECYTFNDMGQFLSVVGKVPAGYLPAEFGCPFIEMIDGRVDARYKAIEAYNYFISTYSILTGFQKGVNTIPSKPGEGLMAINETYEGELNCRACNHEKATEINTALKDGRSLRDIEKEFAVSRSTLSRHKAHCLNPRG